MPTNQERAAWAYEALKRFSELVGPKLDHNEDCADAIADLVCDLGHYAKSRGLNPIELMERGAGMWSAEDRALDGDPHVNDIAEIVMKLHSPEPC